MLSSDGDKTVLISGLTAKFFRSLDSGQTWAALTLPPGETSYVRNCTWVSGTRWLAQGNSNTGSYFISTDNGTTWASTTLPFTPGGVSQFYVDPANRTRVWITSGANIYLSTDSGTTFSATSTKTFTNTISRLMTDGLGKWIVLLNVNPVGQYSISTDNGSTWSAQQVLSSTQVYISGVWNGTYWVVGATNAASPVYYSATGTGTWQTANPGLGVWAMEYNPVDGSIVAVGDATTTPASSRQTITKWVNSPVAGLTGNYIRLCAVGNYWLACGGANVIMAPRAR
jgi:xyloglucan-specific exo-beta-1,4-glucanase